MIICGEFVAWADGEAARIERGEPQRYHAVLCDPPYGLEFMGKEWDAPHKSFADPKRLPNVAYAKAHGCPSGNKGYSGIKGPSSFEAGNGYQRWTTAWAAALIPLLYPGALVFCFGGTRTWHRLACGFEDAGFQMWDTLMWIHGQGFPKAQDISKLIDKTNGNQREVVGEYQMPVDSDAGNAGKPTILRGDGGPFTSGGNVLITAAGSEVSNPWSGHKTAALKPAWEPVLCFKAPTQGKTYAELALEYGSGALNVDGGRIPCADAEDQIAASSSRNTPSKAFDAYGGDPSCDRSDRPRIGRYPANLTLECTCEEVEVVDAPDTRIEKPCPNPEITGHKWGTLQGNRGPRGYAGKAIRHTDPKYPAAMLDALAGDLHGAGNVRPSLCRVNSDRTYSGGWIPKVENPNFYNNKGGGPSRFFYCAKASRGEREAGLRGVLPCVGFLDEACTIRCSGIDTETHINWKGQVVKCHRNDHPTVKPVEHCRWLAMLLLPPPLRVPSLRSQESDGLHRSPQVGPESRIPRRLLVPFAGTGSEMIGALEAGWDDVTGIEQDAHYCQIGRARVKHWTAQGRFKECPPGAARWPRLHRLAGIALRMAGFPVRRLTRSRPTSATD